MYEDEQNEKKQLTIFSAIAFGMPVIMGFIFYDSYVLSCCWSDDRLDDWRKRQ